MENERKWKDFIMAEFNDELRQDLEVDGDKHVVRVLGASNENR